MTDAASSTDSPSRPRTQRAGRSRKPRVQTVAERRSHPLDMAELTSHTGYLLRRAQLAIFADIIAAHQALDVRPAEFSVLMLLEHNPGAIHADIADALGIKRANFVVLFNGLEKRGLVVRRKAEGDRRAQALFLTEAGVAMLAELRKAARRHEAKIVTILGIDGHEALRRMLAEIGDIGKID